MPNRYWTTTKVCSLLVAVLFVMFGLGAAMGAAITSSQLERVSADQPIKENPTEQTWEKSYRQTSCADWLDRMTPDQRYVTATDLLGGFSWSASSRVEPGNARNFVNAITQECHGEISRNVVRTAWDLYQDRPGEWD